MSSRFKLAFENKAQEDINIDAVCKSLEALSDLLETGYNNLDTLNVFEGLIPNTESFTNCEAKLIEHNLNHIKTKAGYKVSKKLSTESISDSRVIAIESIRDVAKTIVDSIIKAFLKLKEYVVQFNKWLKQRFNSDKATVTQMSQVVLPKLKEQEKTISKAVPSFKNKDPHEALKAIHDVKIAEVQKTVKTEKVPEIKEQIKTDYEQAVEKIKQLAVPADAYYYLRDKNKDSFSELHSTVMSYISTFESGIDTKFMNTVVRVANSTVTFFTDAEDSLTRYSDRHHKTDGSLAIQSLEDALSKIKVNVDKFKDAFSTPISILGGRIVIEQNEYKSAFVSVREEKQEPKDNVGGVEQMLIFDLFIEHREKVAGNETAYFKLKQQVEITSNKLGEVFDKISTSVRKLAALDGDQRTAAVEKMISLGKDIMRAGNEIVVYLESFSRHYYTVQSQVVAAMKSLMGWTAASYRINEDYLIKDYGYHRLADDVDARSLKLK